MNIIARSAAGDQGRWPNEAIGAFDRPVRWTNWLWAEMVRRTVLDRSSALPLPKSLVDGHRRFRRDVHTKDRGRYRQLAELGQAPTAMVIACCDARVDVSAIFDAEAGALFIMRNVANLVPPYEPEGRYHGTSAAVEYAVTALKVPHLIVLGHSHCGGVATYRRGVRDNVPEHGFIGRWLTLLDDLPLIESDIFAYGDEMAFEFAAVRSSIANLGTFPFIQKRMKEGLLELHGLHFDLGSGRLMLLEEGTGRFKGLGEA
jgi:carbonic anhydrase